jgi:hypothetical protein
MIFFSKFIDICINRYESKKIVDKIVYKHQNNMLMTKAEKYFFSVKDILGIIRQLKSKRWYK